MKRLLICVLLCLVISYGVLIYRDINHLAFPIDSVSKNEVLNKVSESSGNIVKIIEEGYQWYIAELDDEEVYEEFKSLMKEPKQAEYRIVYNQKEGHTLSRTLVNDGWVEAAQNRSWMIVCNENVNEQKSYPVRDGIIQRNNHVWRFYQHLVIILSLLIVFNLVQTNAVIFDMDGTLFQTNTIL